MQKWHEMLAATARPVAVAIVLLLAVATGGVHAQVPSPAPSSAAPSSPPALTQEQIDAMVRTITTTVLEKLKAEQAKPAAAAKPAPARRGPLDADDADEPDHVDIFVQQTMAVLKTVPAFAHYLGDFRTALDDSPNGGMGRRVFLLFLLAVAAVAVSAETAVRFLLRHVRTRVAATAGPELGLRSLWRLAMLLGLDVVAVLAVWLVNRAAVTMWFSGTSIQARFAAAFLLAVLLWRLYSLVFRVMLRPTLPTARLCDVGDTEAGRLYRLASVFILVAIMLRLTYYVLLAVQAPAEAIAAGRIVTAPILLAVLLWIVFRTRNGMRQWLIGLGQAAPVMGLVGRNWIALSVPFFVGLILTQIYGAITGRPNVPVAMILTLNVVVGLLVFETLLQSVVRRLDSQLPGFTPAGDRRKLPDVVARCIRVAVLIGVIVVLAESWVVDVLRLVDDHRWDRLTRAGRAAGITLFVAFVVWELFKYATESYMQRLSQSNGAPAASPQTGVASTRFDTLMPVIRVTVAILILLIAVLIALDDLGVNIGPLLAGASVLGLAISFGSQTLVRDIVSGIFYLGDDAFRVGEYIDCGRAKGTVEGFTLRSIRLRHQNGQVHTIPFGSLGQITNFSRDWTVVKFTLPFARNTDLEKLRKAAKKIGVEMMEEPDLKAELIEPFKMQGIADVTDNALIVRFKFMARPGNPNLIQNQAVTRLLRALPDLGIELSQPPK